MLNVHDEGRYAFFEQFTYPTTNFALLLTKKVVNIQKLSLYRCKKAVRLYVELKVLYFIS